MSEESAPQTIEVWGNADVTVAQEAAKSLARALAFDAPVGEELALAVSELASNLLKHAGHGRLTLASKRDGERTGMQIVSTDSGPGIANVDQAITDGFSTAGSLGYGLGAVNRLMDELEITSHPAGNAKETRIVCTRWKRAHGPTLIPCPLDIGVAIRPHRAMEVNGDAYILERWGESALVGVIDGVGHGPGAFQAAQAARLYVETHRDGPLDAIFSGVGRACRGTQGVVMALARFDWGCRRLTFASVGNIEARTFGTAQKVNFIVPRGVLGLNAPAPKVTEHLWDPTQVMVLHSDGLVSHWQWEDFPNLQAGSAGDAAQQMLHKLAREDDDATVVVVKGKPRPVAPARLT
jgi:anti-sigma regulatory factor (Ser/Thr protein kinase)